MKKRKAMTLVEVVVSMILLSLVITTSIWLVLAMAKGQKKSYYEYDLQNSVRLASMNLTNVINESSAIFTIQEGGIKFNESSPKKEPINLTKEWDYYFVSYDGKSIVRYAYDASGTHRKEIVVPEQPGIRYRLRFDQPKDASGNVINNKFIGYKLEVYRVEKENSLPLEEQKQWEILDSYTVETHLEAKSASQVVFRGTDFKPNIALAVRSLKGPLRNQKSIAYVTFVLDVSGSMDWHLAGKESSVGEKRYVIMKKALKNILAEYMKEENVEVVLIPFSSTANYPDPDVYLGTTAEGDNHPIYSKNKKAIADGRSGPMAIRDFTEKTQYENHIDNQMPIRGGTNVGDALRRVRFSIDYINTTYSPKYYPGQTISHYLILLVDGAPTSYTAISKTGLERDIEYYNKSGNYYSIRSRSDGGYEAIVEGAYKRHTPLWLNYKLYGNKYSVSYPAYDIYDTGKLDVTKHKSALAIGFYGPKLVSRVKKTFVIGFSTVPGEVAGVDFIAKSCGVPPTLFDKQVFKYTSTTTPDLSELFAIIKKQIMDDLWLIRGPDI